MGDAKNKEAEAEVVQQLHKVRAFVIYLDTHADSRTAVGAVAGLCALEYIGLFLRDINYTVGVEQGSVVGLASAASSVIDVVNTNVS
jgi:hypothetical protein